MCWQENFSKVVESLWASSKMCLKEKAEQWYVLLSQLKTNFESPNSCRFVQRFSRVKCSMSSSLFLQRWHQNDPWKDCLIKYEPMGILLKRMFHISIHVLGAALSFQSAFHQCWTFFGWTCYMSFRYPSLGEYFPFFAKIHTTLSSYFIILMCACVRASVKSTQYCLLCLGIWSSCAVFQACWKRMEFASSAMLDIWVTPWFFRRAINCVGSRWAFPHPIQGSTPIWTTFPSFIFHVRPSRMRGREFSTTFHMLDLLPLTLCSLQIQ